MKVVQTLLSLFLALAVLGSPALAQPEDEFSLDKTYDIDSDGTLRLYSDDADLVQITGSDREDVHVNVHYTLKQEGFKIGQRQRFRIDVEQRYGNLSIRERPRERQGFSVNLGSQEEVYTIKIEVPSGISLDIEGDDDIYEIRGITGIIEMDTDDGEISLNKCEAEEYRIDFDDGELVMQGGSGILDLNMDDGSADIRAGRFQRVMADMDDGEIKLETQLADDGNYNFTLDDGSMDFTALSGGGTVRVHHDGIRVATDSEYRIVRGDEDFNEFELAGGNAHIQIDTDKGDVRLFTR